jgi:transmembrane sensor
MGPRCGDTRNRDGNGVDASTGELDAAIERAMEWLLRREMAPGDADLEHDFQRWLAESEVHRKAYEAVQSTWAELGELPGTARKASGAGAPANVVGLPVRPPRRRRWYGAAAALVAACVLVSAFPSLHRSLIADYDTGVAELRDVSLPDGSVVQLDAGSAITVDYEDAERRITLLAGQAFFRVVRDGQRPFSVIAGDVSVVVTGTSFSVAKTRTTIDVAVQTGRVEVLRDGRSQGAPLTVGDRLVVDRSGHAVHRERLSPEQVASWRNRRLVVVDTSFGDIIETLGRHLPGLVLVRDGSLNRQAITGVFDLTQPFEALRTLAMSQNATVTEVTPYLLIISRR